MSNQFKLVRTIRQEDAVVIYVDKDYPIDEPNALAVIGGYHNHNLTINKVDDTVAYVVIEHKSTKAKLGIVVKYVDYKLQVAATIQGASGNYKVVNEKYQFGYYPIKSNRETFKEV